MTERSESVAAQRPNVLAELRRRNVIRMAGLYLVGAWLLVQIADTLLPVFDAPGWVMKVLVGMLALGLLPTLVFSWLYEMTPEGLKRDADVDPTQSITSHTARRLDLLTLAAVAVLLLVIAADRYWPRAETAGSESTFTEASAPAASAATANVVSDTGLADAVTADVRPGIAVLPFDNFSPDPENAYFTSGVYEEVLTKLSRIGALRVISRTSMERIAKEDLAVDVIGARLGVSHVLEGSVRRAGDKVRVTVQLIEAATDAHVWAENYDRGLDDVFAIQTEIALAIADQLKLSLSAQLQADLGERPTQNQAAYELYLKALDNNRSWRYATGFLETIDLLEPAVRLDPDFLAAQVLLAEAYGRMYWLRADPDGRYLALARQLVGQVAARWPDRPEAELAQAQLSYNIDRDYARALQGFEAVRRRLPNDPAVLNGISASLKRLDRYPEFLASARIALAADPEAPARHSEVLLALVATQQYADSIAFAEQAERKFPEDLSLALNAARVRAYHDQSLEPLIALGRRFEENRTAPPGLEIAVANFVSGDLDTALRMLEPGQSGDGAIDADNDATRAELLRLAGRAEEATALARRSYTALHRKEDIYTPAVGYASLAWLAAEAGELDAARDWQAKASASPPLSLEERSSVASSLSGAQRALGDAEAAWQLLEFDIGDGMSFSDAHLTLFRPYYDRLFGASPSYRAYMASIETKP
jgi:TolB-like protein